MRKVILTATVIVVGLLAIPWLGCGDAQPADGEKTGQSSQEGAYEPAIVPDDFVAVVDNEYYPLAAGTTYIYQSSTDEGIERVEIFVTGEKKEILGIQCSVVRDTVTIDGEVAELTLDWFAQDKDGNVWYFGEDSKEYENGEVSSTQGSWEAGVDGAQPGIIMQAHPVVGEEYRQEYDAGNAEDMAEVVSLGEAVSVPTGSYTACLKTREWTPLEPGVTEFKYYAPGIGLILETAGASESQRLELVEIEPG